ncbi:MAG: hypothetical protein EBY21_04780 [Alphaproteobacteria bacterium]|nr:hypothetical protein [Alphaproteobacteria bacterium]
MEEARLPVDESKRNLIASALPHTPNLADAIRRARIEDAERSDVITNLRNGELARLESLREALIPIFEQIPDMPDLFDMGIMPSARPRLYIDMLGFVEMGHDRRVYRFIQDLRHQRLTLAESDRIDHIVQAVTDYVARRLIEREKALAHDSLSAATPAATQFKISPDLAANDLEPSDLGRPQERPSRPSLIASAILFVIEVLGTVALGGLLTLALIYAYQFALIR